MTDRFIVSNASVRLRARGGKAPPDRRHWIIRPHDLLVLGFDLVGLRVEPGRDRPAQVVSDGSRQGYLVVWFPPQHLSERAYFTTKEPDGKTDISIPVAIPPTGHEPPLEDPDAPSGQPASGTEDPDPPPIDAIIAGWSRLVFHVPPDKLPIDWTLDGLLGAMRALELSVPANALPPRRPTSLLGLLLSRGTARTALLTSETLAADVSAQGQAGPLIAAAAHVIAQARGRRKARTIGNALGLTAVTGSASLEIAGAVAVDVLRPSIPPILMRPEPAPPGPNQTALELPYHLILSPNRFGAWFHEDQPMISDATGHTELWHTRLGVRRQDGTSIDGDDALRKLRAVWALDRPWASNPLGIPDHDNDPWRMSLDAFDRHNVMHLSSNFRLADGNDEERFYEPGPLDVNMLALSALGAWLDSRGAWEFRQPTGLSVEEWRHRATLGRDHYVRVVYAGFLFPFGHRASLIKITERQFDADTDGNPAYLRQRMFLVVREPVKTYRTSGLKRDDTGEQYDLMMPFEAVRILTLVSPLLDPPEKDHIASKKQSAFWPRVGGQPFSFHLNATDTDGNQVDMAMPLIFVGKEETDKAYEGEPPIADSIIPTAVKQAYETTTWPDGSTLRSTVALGGQKLAFAESDGPDDTAFAVQTLTFGAEVPSQKTYDDLGPKRVRYFPAVRKAQIDVPALQRIARTSTPAGVVFATAYLKAGFTGPDNAGQLFFAADPDPAVPRLGVSFSSQGDRCGGLVTPDLKMSGVSRVTGPVAGDLKAVAVGSFNAKDWFGAISGAKLFGVLSLGDIIGDAQFTELDKLPQFAGQSLNQVEQVISGLERLQQLVSVEPPDEAAAVSSLLDQLLDPATGSIPALTAGGTVAPVAAQLASLNTELAALQAALPASTTAAPGPKALIVQSSSVLENAIGGVLAEIDLLARFADGDILPQALNARFDWRPVLKSVGPFNPNGGRNLLLSVEAADAHGALDETFTITCALDDFVLDLEVLVLDFERVQIQTVAGRKMDVDVRFNGFAFAGPLAFVDTLRELIPFDGFSDPPDVQVTPAGITAGFTAGLPNISVGVFSLENLSLGAGFDVPFVGKPLSTWFAFCTRENPSRLTVSLFGGGFYLGLTVDANGLQIFEGAIEFGAACSVDFGVASGSVSAMAGLYFKIEGSDVTLAGYFRLRGEVEALGIVSVSIELYLEMRYESSSGKCTGTATLSIEIDVALFSTTIEISATKKFAGSGKDPTLAELMDVQPDATSEYWNAYCEAFA